MEDGVEDGVKGVLKGVLKEGVEGVLEGVLKEGVKGVLEGVLPVKSDDGLCPQDESSGAKWGKRGIPEKGSKMRQNSHNPPTVINAYNLLQNCGRSLKINGN